MTDKRLTIAILSLGSMGVGIGKLLVSQGHHVITNVSNRSPSTIARAESASITSVPTDADLLHNTDIFLSIVPPKDSFAVATRIQHALAALPPRNNRLFYFELNAISPTSARKCADVFAQTPEVCFVDGGIIGGPPKLKPDGTWSTPWVPLSGPTVPPEGFVRDLSGRWMGGEVGAASGLKMCFASLTKGFTAIAIQSFSTAKTLGVLEELKEALDEHAPGFRPWAQAGLLSCPPKAYRWIREMEEISDTFSDAGFRSAETRRGGDLFKKVAETYTFVAEETNCGKEDQDARTTSTADEVVSDLAASLKRRASI